MPRGLTQSHSHTHTNARMQSHIHTQVLPRRRQLACRIQDTRKTVPGLRLLDKWAVQLGGGTPHRMGLYDMMMIKDNHIAAAGGIRCVRRAGQGPSVFAAAACVSGAGLLGLQQARECRQGSTLHQNAARTQ